VLGYAIIHTKYIQTLHTLHTYIHIYVRTFIRILLFTNQLLSADSWKWNRSKSNIAKHEWHNKENWGDKRKRECSTIQFTSLNSNNLLTINFQIVTIQVTYTCDRSDNYTIRVMWKKLKGYEEWKCDKSSK